MSGNSSEEKSLPASSKKLTEERKKGKIAKGPDLLVAITTGALIGYVLLTASSIAARLQALMATAASSIEMDFNHGARIMLAEVQSTLLACGMAGMAIAVAAAILGSMLINKGFVFSLDPVMPKLDKLNPVSGIKNLFKVNNLVEFAKSVVKAALFGGALVGVARGAFSPLLELPACGPRCIPAALHAMLMPLFLLAVVFYLASGVVDLLIQKWLFMRDMRMTKTESKRENKDSNGNPLVKGQQRRLRQESAGDGFRLGFAQATLMICGADLVVGLRYVQGETPLPQVVCRAVGEKSRQMAAAARAQGLPMFWNAPLAADLSSGVTVGKVITMKFFSRVAQAILLSGTKR